MVFFHFKKKEVPHPSNEELFSKIREIISKQLNMPEEKITPDSKLIDGLGIDSIGGVELVMELEEVFGIEIPDEDAEKMETVKDIVNFIASKSEF